MARKVAKKPAKKAAANPKKKVPEATPLLDLAPDKLPVTERRAKHLAELAGVEAKALVGRTIAEVHDRLRWRIDPGLLLFRRVCGQVVQRDPATGELLPVPNATVHVEDTDCNFIGYFPAPSPWVWLFPWGCRREEIATVRTDECGRFCVYLPYWDIDRILRWRRLRICLWEFFYPRLRDLLEPPILERWPPLPDPLPDPPRFRRIVPEAFERLRDIAGDEVVTRLRAAGDLALRGENLRGIDALLDEPVFPRATPPPLPEGFDAGRETRELASLHPDLPVEKIDFRRFVGPFLRCHDVWLATWQTVLDVPDITFRVTQDYDHDGVEEVIYSEGFFDVRWDSGSIPNVVLEASADALATANCGPVVEIPCGNAPSIETAGYLDLEPAYHDDVAGYGLRVNRPSPTGDFPPPPATGVPSAVPATAPYALNLNLHGCFRIGNATHYRLKKEYRARDVDPWGAQTPFLGVTWVAPRQGPGAPIPFVPDADGWYPIVNPAILVHPNWLLPWETRHGSDGLYRIQLELGRLVGGAIHSTGTSAKRIFRVDNAYPSASFLEVRWRLATTVGPWNDANSTVVLPAPAGTCPVIQRPTGQDLHVRVAWTASAAHLRDAALIGSGCGGGGFVLLDGGVEAYRHWHTGPLDNNVTQTNHFLLPSARPPGCYTLAIHAWTRAFNPQDFNAASTHDWWVNEGIRWTWPSRAISVVDV